jgi:Tim17/Tim22/Tim23/Pmp24 family
MAEGTKGAHARVVPGHSTSFTSDRFDGRLSPATATTVATLPAMTGGDDVTASEKGIVASAADGVIVAAPMGFAIGSAKAFLDGHSPEAKAAFNTSAAGASAPKPSTLSPTAAARTAALAAAYVHPITQISSVTGMFAAVGAVYCGTEALLESSRGKHDVWNKAIAGCAAGSLVGVRSRSVYASSGACAAFAAMNLFLDAVGGNPGSAFGDNPNLVKRRKIYETPGAE